MKYNFNNINHDFIIYLCMYDTDYILYNIYHNNRFNVITIKYNFLDC